MRKHIAGFVLALLIGSLSGAVLGVGIHCIQGWRHGIAFDPRCVYGWKGYVTEHVYFETGERVSCVYRPDITGER